MFFTVLKSKIQIKSSKNEYINIPKVTVMVALDIVLVTSWAITEA